MVLDLRHGREERISSLDDRLNPIIAELLLGDFVLLPALNLLPFCSLY